MTSFKLFVSGIALFSLIHGCGEILEPVVLTGGKQDEKNGGFQEEFDIEIKSLTFRSAREANNSPYQRRLMRSGVGAAANVIDEEELLTSNLPFSSKGTAYLLGNGDKLQYTRSLKFVESDVQFPTQPVKEDYLLGVGDELTLLQLNESTRGTRNIISGGTRNIISSTPKKDGEQNTNVPQLSVPQSSQSVLRTSSTVGTDGNILLLDLGSIRAANRSLKNVQTEVRNILIRNGLAPNFQLEITGFNSRKAFVTFPAEEDTFGKNIVPLTNLPVTLKELAINYGLRPSSDDATVVSLTRNGQKFRMTAGQMFKKSSPRVVIKDGDQIEIDEIEGAEPIEVVVGSKGLILIPGVGSIKAKNRSLSEVQTDITRTLTKKGFVPNFQLEITEFSSKEFYVVTKNGSKSIPLDSFELDLRTAIGRNYSLNSNDETLDSRQTLTIVKITRKGLSYRTTLTDVLTRKAGKFYIQDGDTIELRELQYKQGQVFALSGSGKAKAVSISPSKRQTLADILFTANGALSNVMARRSEVYLLRGRVPSVAYHLDAQNVSRILVAAETELRPNDIVFVADRPIISFARALSEVFPLRLLLRDIRNDNFP